MMLGESRWKVLVLIAGLLLAQAIDSPGRGSLQLKNVRQIRRSYIPNLPSQWSRHSRSFQGSTALSADIATTGIAGYPNLNAEVRRPRIQFRDEQYGQESRLHENYSPSENANDSIYNTGPSGLDNVNNGNINSNAGNSKVAFEDDTNYDPTGVEENISQSKEEVHKSKPLYAEAFDRESFSFPQSGVEENQQYQEKFGANQRFNEFNAEIPRKLRGSTNVGFPVSKSYHPRYPYYNPFFTPPSVDYDNGYYGHPYHGPGDFNPLVKNGYFGPGFAPKSPVNQPFWKTRTPRVVFPNGNDGPLVQSNSHQGGTGNVLANAINYNNDNVVFRDQNFGLNELAAIQDLRNDFNLQDIGISGFDDNSIKDKETLGSQNHNHQIITKQKRRRGRTMDLHEHDKTESEIQDEKNKNKTINDENNYLLIKKIIIDFMNDTENEDNVTEQSIFDSPEHNVTVESNITINPKIDPFGPITEYVPPRGIYSLPSAIVSRPDPGVRIQDSIRIPNEVTRKPISGTRNPKTLQYLLPLLTYNKNSEAGKAAPYLAPNPPFDNEIKDFNENKRDDNQKCNQGGTCEFFLYCWMSGGLLDGTCGLLKGCCHKLAKAASLGVQDSNVLSNLLGSEPGEPLEFGPVVNDNSKSLQLS